MGIGFGCPLESVDATTADLVMLVMRLCRRLDRNDHVRIAAQDFLVRKGLNPSPLRSESSVAGSSDKQR